MAESWFALTQADLTALFGPRVKRCRRAEGPPHKGGVNRATETGATSLFAP